MVKKIVEVTDFKEVLECVNEIQDMYLSSSCDLKALSDKILFLSDAIINSEEKNKTNVQIYSSASVKVMECLSKNQKLSNKLFYEWYGVVKQLLAVIFIYNTVDALICESDDEYLNNLLIDYFSSRDNDNITLAHYFAVRRIARQDAKRCYDLYIEDYKKYPDLLKRIYKKSTYVYDQSSICDEIYKECPICSSGDSEYFYCANQALLNRNNFSPAKLWMKCKSCGNLYAYNFPMQKNGEINGHYTRKNSNGLLEPRNLLNIYSNIFNHVREINNGRRYLEVGIGCGEMLAVAMEMGYDVSAVEICKEDCENVSGALGVDIKWCDFLKYETPDKYDVIIMGDVLEHVGKPIDALKKAYDMLDDGGVLWLSTPNFESAFSRMRKFADPMWNQANHFTYFSYDGLKPFLDKLGFEVKRYDVSNRYNGSMELFLQKN